jgi:hypothetical protein
LARQFQGADGILFLAALNKAAASAKMAFARPAITQRLSTGFVIVAGRGFTEA